MPVTGLRGRQILDGDVVRADLNITTEGSAVIRRIIAGTNISITSTGVDSGTGDVTISATGTGLNGTGFVRMAGTTVSYITGTSAQFVKADGSLDSSSYFANGDYYAPNTTFGQRPLRSQIVDNVLYQADSRFAVTRTDNSTRLGNALFNGNYDQTALTIAAGTSLTFSINFTANGNSSITYTEGAVYLHFYYTSVPASVSGRVKDSGGTWRNITGWTNVSTNGSFAVWRGNVPGFNYLTDMEITITAPAGGTANFSQWEYVMGRPGQYEWGVISKMQNNNLWTNLNFRNGTNASTISLVASTGVVTAASFVRTSGTSSQFLKADGSVDSTTYHSGNSIWSQVFGVYAVGANTAITNTDTLETALEKLQGQVNARLTGNQTITVSGDASGSGATAIALTLATVNSNVGTFNNVTVNAKGLVTAASNISYLTGNQTISLTGEATGSGATSIAVTLTNSAVIGKVLTGLNITGGTVAAADTILTAFGKLQNQVNGLTGGVTYQGTWNASTNTPTLASSAGTKGFYYVVSVAGSTALNGVSTWSLGDWVIYNGTAWEKVDNTDAVISVNGFTGAVSLTTANVSESGNLYYTDARARAAITLTTTGSSGAATYSGGTLNIPTYTLAGLGGQTALNGTGFVKISGTTITYDNSTYALSSHTHSYFIGTTAVQTSSANQGLTGISSIGFVAEGSDSASISTTISGTSTFFDFNLTDDNNNDEWRWRFTPSGATVYNAMRLVPVSNTAANLIVSGTITGSQIIRSGGTSSQFLKADGSVDSTAYTTNTGTVTSVSGTGTVSGLTLSGTVTTSGSLTLGGTLSASIDNITDEHRLFNNMGDSHGTRTSFDASTPSYNFGFRYVQGNTNGPATGGGGQFYSWYLGLGNDYPATGGGSYGMYVAIPRSATTPYMSIRYNENNSLGSWIKIAAGYADTAGALTSMNISQFTNNSGYLTGITSGQVTTALGYTPYNSTNPNGYITASSSNTLTNKSGNISQWTNDSGYITATSSTYTYSASLTLSTSWQNTGVTSANLTAGGVYIISCFANDYSVSGSQYSCTYAGVMYWYTGGSNSVDTISEIALHHSGHHDGGRFIYLRTLSTLSADGKTYLQIKGNGNNSAASTYSFTFKRLL